MRVHVQVYFKEWARGIAGAGEAEICGASQRAGDTGRHRRGHLESQFHRAAGWKVWHHRPLLLGESTLVFVRLCHAFD